MRRSIREKLNLKKITSLAIGINLFQIAAALCLLIYVALNRSINIPEQAEIALVAVMAGIVIWGAAVDIRDAFVTRKVDQQRDMLEDAYLQLEQLNHNLRAQRHDFKNHLQVIYSLTEMQAYSDVQDYVQHIYQDVQALGSCIRTSVPAVNALISAKAADCEEKHIAFETEIQSSWEEIPVPGWEMCRIIGNLVDNAVDAVQEQEGRKPSIRIRIGEDIRSWILEVANNGPEIPRARRLEIFLPGFTTKAFGRGNGLSIVKELIEKYDGELDLHSDDASTRFRCSFPKNAIRSTETK